MANESSLRDRSLRQPRSAVELRRRMPDRLRFEDAIEPEPQQFAGNANLAFLRPRTQQFAGNANLAFLRPRSPGMDVGVEGGDVLEQAAPTPSRNRNQGELFPDIPYRAGRALSAYAAANRGEPPDELQRQRMIDQQEKLEKFKANNIIIGQRVGQEKDGDKLFYVYNNLTPEQKKLAQKLPFEQVPDYIRRTSLYGYGSMPPPSPPPIKSRVIQPGEPGNPTKSTMLVPGAAPSRQIQSGTFQMEHETGESGTAVPVKTGESKSVATVSSGYERPSIPFQPVPGENEVPWWSPDRSSAANQAAVKQGLSTVAQTAPKLAAAFSLSSMNAYADALGGALNRMDPRNYSATATAPFTYDEEKARRRLQRTPQDEVDVFADY